MFSRLKAGTGVGKVYSGIKGSFSCALIGGCWHAEAAGGLTRSRASQLVRDAYLCPKLESRAKCREAIFY